ncbi:MAG: class II aldolase/adducin family protein [Candidatus Kerfeldbacteria bacterium]
METYQGVKFTTRFLERYVPSSPQTDDLLKWCHRLAEYNEGASGNLSVRTENGCLITGTGIVLSEATVDDLVEIVGWSEDQREIEAIGLKEPSSEAFLHLKIYEEKGTTNAVFHGHLLDLPDVPVTEQELPYGTLALADAVLLLAQNHDLVVARNHGFFSLGSSMEDAGNRILHAITTTNGSEAIHTGSS